MSDDEDPGIRSELARRAAHEVRSPLGVVTGAIDQIAARIGEGDPESRRWLELAQRSSRRLLWLAERMDWISRGGQATPAAHPEGSLVELTQRAVRAAEAATGRRRIEVHIDSAGDTPLLGPDAVSHAIAEVVHNAIAHARARVTVRVEVEGSVARVQVQDDGRGFEHPEWAERLPPDERSGSGLGLGLWLARRLLASVKGSLAVENAGPEGTRMRIELPAHQPSSPVRS
jgi:signal transduction histidine kinase